MVAKFRQSVTFQSPPSAVDSRGQSSGDWTNEATRRAEVKRLTGRDRETAGQLYEQSTWKVTIWYESTSFANDWRISWGSRTLEIGNINNVDEQNRTLEFLCSEVG